MTDNPMTSTERAIQAATEITRNHTFSQDEEWRGYLVGVAKEAVEAALATGELHAADECPNRRNKLKRLPLSPTEETRLRRALDKACTDYVEVLGERDDARKRIKELEELLPTYDYEHLTLRAEEAESELADTLFEFRKLQAELADLKFRIENGELIPREQLREVTPYKKGWAGDHSLNSFQASETILYRLLDKEPSG